MLNVRLTRQKLIVRKAVAVVLILFGLTSCVAGVSSWAMSARSPVGVSVTIIRVLLLAAGTLIFVTELFESWLSRGQAALVDGLQAG